LKNPLQREKEQTTKGGGGLGFGVFYCLEFGPLPFAAPFLFVTKWPIFPKKKDHWYYYYYWDATEFTRKSNLGPF